MKKIEIIITIDEKGYHSRPSAPVPMQDMPAVIDALTRITESLKVQFGNMPVPPLPFTPPVEAKKAEPVEGPVLSPIQRDNIKDDL